MNTPLWSLLWRPFDQLTGRQSLVWGLFAIGLTALWASRSGLVTDGVLDLHLWGASVGVLPSVAMGLVNWLCLGLMLWAVGHWLSAGQYQVTDVFGHQALARWPMLLAVAYQSVPWVRSETERLATTMIEALPSQSHEVMASPAYVLDALWLTLLSSPVLLAVVWMVWLMYHGYARSFQVRGWQAVLGFVIALIVAELISKLLVFGFIV